jgi:hypothetical protein
MAKRKMRKFSDGGFSSAQEEWLGGADRTDPYILARMRSAVPDSPEKSPMGDDSPAGKTGYGEQNDLPETESVTRVTAARTPAKTVAAPKKPAGPTPETPEEYKARMEGLVKKQGLERVSPETALIGGGGLKLLQTAGRNLASKIAGNRKLNEYVVPKLAGPKTPALPSPTPKLTYDKAGAMAKRRDERAAARMKQMKQDNYDAGPAGRARASGAMVDDLTPGGADLLSTQLRPDFKRGGKVKTKMSYKSGGSVSSASKRADGCAIRGKTRA